MKAVIATLVWLFSVFSSGCTSRRAPTSSRGWPRLDLRWGKVSPPVTLVYDRDGVVQLKSHTTRAGQHPIRAPTNGDPRRTGPARDEYVNRRATRRVPPDHWVSSDTVPRVLDLSDASVCVQHPNDRVHHGQCEPALERGGTLT